MKITSWKQKTPNKGMTVIELMIAVVIIGILVAIAITNFVSSSKKRAFETNLLNNMRTLQIMLETYRVDWQAYPNTLDELSAAATEKKYNKAAGNPYTNQRGPVSASSPWVTEFVDPSGGGFNRDFYKGKVGYQWISPTKYYLLGYDSNADLLQRNGKPYLVTSGDKN